MHTVRVPSSVPALTRRVAVLLLLLASIWSAGPSHARQEWPAAVRLVFEAAPDADPEALQQIVGARLEAVRPRRTEIALDSTGRLVVRLRNAGDRDLALTLASQPGAILFARVASDNPVDIQKVLADPATIPQGQLLAPAGDGDSFLLIHGPETSAPDAAPVSGERLRQAAVGAHPATGQPIVTFELDNAGAQAFARLTTMYGRGRIAILLDGQILSAPSVSEPITGGAGFIDAGFSSDGAQALAAMLSAGPLPSPLMLIEESSEE